MTTKKRPPLTARARAHLVAAGHMDDATGATRKARLARCEECGYRVWRGLNADRGAQVVDADPTPLAPLGEAMARIGGWKTITLRWMLDHWIIDIRDQWIIAGEPPGTRANCDVLTVHRCGIDTSALPKGPSRMPDMRPIALPVDPPF